MTKDSLKLLLSHKEFTKISITSTNGRLIEVDKNDDEQPYQLLIELSNGKELRIGRIRNTKATRILVERIIDNCTINGIYIYDGQNITIHTNQDFKITETKNEPV